MSIDSRVPLTDPANVTYIGGSGHEGGGFITRTQDARIILAGNSDSPLLPQACHPPRDSSRAAIDGFLYDALGMKIMQQVRLSVMGTQSVHFSMRGAPPGVYHLVHEAGGRRATKVVIKSE